MRPMCGETHRLLDASFESKRRQFAWAVWSETVRFSKAAARDLFEMPSRR
jgi:hypothetical protein